MTLAQKHRKVKKQTAQKAKRNYVKGSKVRDDQVAKKAEALVAEKNREAAKTSAEMTRMRKRTKEIADMIADGEVTR